MLATSAEGTKLQPAEAREMKQLTGELTEVLKKISRIVLPRAGAKGTHYTLATVILPSASNPLQIGFQNARILNVQSVAKRADEEGGIDMGWYEDPPGICTPDPVCVGE
jgi:hypothetical protein